MDVAIIRFESPEYLAALELRNRLLRLPLGLDVFREDLAQERDQWHFGLFDETDLRGCVIAVPLGGGITKIRQMAIDTAWQGRGLGRQLLATVEQLLRERDQAVTRLHARVAVEPFYLKLGYRRRGAEFMELSIPHIEMDKQL